jgi:transcriptional regulator with PAS, ATPase and Fis domain
MKHFLSQSSNNDTFAESSFIVRSREMRHLQEQAIKVAPYPTIVLIQGESGTGKEWIADLIHYSSPRNRQRFIKINCSSFPESLIDSEIFGYERGAFTGALDHGKAGLFEQADGGTLLLDEIGELPLSLQAKLLRVLQDKQIRRIGGTLTKPVDVRIIASTNRNLREEVKKGTFRLDLYYRLSAITFSIPPLRERKEEIEALLRHYLDHFCHLYQLERSWDERTLQELAQYDWPGNIRELINTVEQLAVLNETKQIGLIDLPGEIRYKLEKRSNSISRVREDMLVTEDPLHLQLSRMEMLIIEKTLERSKSIRRAAEILGLSHTTLIRKMHKYGVRK